MKGGTIGLLDYGQSKQLTDAQRRGLAVLVVALAEERREDIRRGLRDLGVCPRPPPVAAWAPRCGVVVSLMGGREVARVPTTWIPATLRTQVCTTRADAETEVEMAYGMFDTRGKVDPFDPDSPIKKNGIDEFPRDLFFVLRTVQLLRGLANGMGVNNFSTANQWKPLAQRALKH